MNKTITRNHLTLTLVALATLMLTSCTEDFWNDTDSRLYGEWTSTYERKGGSTYDLLSYEVDCYTFNNNGRGIYGYYVTRGGSTQWYEVEFRWEARRNERTAYIRYADGQSETLYYDFDKAGNIVLSRDPNMYNYVGYEWHRYETDLAGSWQSQYEVDGNSRWNISNDKIDIYTFDHNRTGVYYYYNDKGQWTSVGFIWGESNNKRGEIYVRYDDGVSETLYYDFNNNELLISRQGNFYSYVGYWPYN